MNDRNAVEAEYERLWQLCRTLQEQRQELYFRLVDEEVRRVAEERGLTFNGGVARLPEGTTKKELDALNALCRKRACARKEYRALCREEDAAWLAYKEAQRQFFALPSVEVQP